jgi:epoxide hydrolase 4
VNSLAPENLAHDYATVNGVSLHYAHAGAGPLIVFLHGFPQCWFEFRHQLAEFSRDHLAVAPDLRGYNLSGKPQALHEYGVFAGVEDLRQLVENLGYERFILVGHDWGGAIAWSFALHYPEMLERLVVLSAPHPALFERELRANPEQQEASQYMLALRAPNSEELLAADDHGVLRTQFDQLEFLSRDEVNVYHEAWQQPGALTGMVSWYRREGLGPATEDGTPSHGDYARESYSQIVAVPTLVLYADGDLYTRPGCHRGLEDYVPDLRFKNFKGHSHWLPDELPEVVNAEIREFIATDVEAPASQGAV